MSGSTNSKIKAQNKQIKKQNQYDKQFYDYSWQQSLDNFEKSKQLRRLNIKNDRAATDYKNKTAADQYRYQVKMQAQQYRDETSAYNRSVSDYKQQRGLNKMAAQVSLSSEQRVRDEALIENMFGKREDSLAYRKERADLKNQKLQQNNIRDTAKVDRDLKMQSVNIDQTSQDNIYTSEQTKLQNQIDNIDDERTSVTDLDDQDKIIYDEDSASIGEQKTQIEDQSEFELGNIDREYQKSKSENLSQRMDQYAESLRARGALAAQGRRGQSADAQNQSALASYGRQQAQMVNSMVFASQDKASSRGAATSKRDFEVAQLDRSSTKLDAEREKQKTSRDLKKGNLGRDKTSAEADKDISTYSKNRQDKQNLNQKSQIEAALDATKSEVKLAKQSLTNRMGYGKEEWKLNKDKFKANKSSAQKAYQAAKNKIRLDRYGADLAAKANVMQKPSRPPALPKPRRIPKTRFLAPMRPQKPPKPIKGAMAKTSIWNDIGDAANIGLKIANFF